MLLLVCFSHVFNLIFSLFFLLVLCCWWFVHFFLSFSCLLRLSIWFCYLLKPWRHKNKLRNSLSCYNILLVARRERENSRKGSERRKKTLIGKFMMKEKEEKFEWDNWGEPTTTTQKKKNEICVFLQKQNKNHTKLTTHKNSVCLLTASFFIGVMKSNIIYCWTLNVNFSHLHIKIKEQIHGGLSIHT